MAAWASLNEFILATGFIGGKVLYPFVTEDKSKEIGHNFRIPKRMELVYSPDAELRTRHGIRYYRKRHRLR